MDTYFIVFVLDGRKMDFVDASFELVSNQSCHDFNVHSFDNISIIDKGTTDAMLCGISGFKSVNEMYKEIYRVLSSGTYFLSSFLTLLLWYLVVSKSRPTLAYIIAKTVTLHHHTKRVNIMYSNL